MNGSSVNKNNKLAGWIDEFVSSFASKTAEPVLEVKTAEVNINDLDKIVWNDETFYVFFEEGGASVINGFGNAVTTIPGAKTLEEVDQKLNSKQIVSEVQNTELEINAEMELEINKALAYVNNEVTIASEEDDKKAEEYVDGYKEQQPTQPAVVQPEVIQPAQQQPQVMATVTEPQMMVGTALKSFDYSEKTAELLNVKMAEFEEAISNMLDTKLNSAMEQFYARVNPGNIYDMATQIVQQEIAKFTQEANETTNKINQENNTDRTTPEGRYSVTTAPESITMDIVTNEVPETTEEIMPEETVEVTEEPVTEESVVEESENEKTSTEDPTNESTEEEDEEEIIGEDADTFRQASCPFCRSTLAKTGLNNNFVQIKCGGCEVEYKVDVNTEKIYLK